MGCHFKCDFCAVQTVFNATQTRRPIDKIIAEIEATKHNRKLFFFVDDNITSNLAQAKEFFRALIPCNIRWVSQSSINAAHDEEFLDLLHRSGCKGVLIGFESLNPANLKAMNKSFNTMRGGFETALANLHRHDIRVYGTFVFGYDFDTPDSFDESVVFAKTHNMYISAFNHLTPFPGTPLYSRLEKQGRLRFEKWWLDAGYSYNMIPFSPAGMSAEQLQQGCLSARRKFYSWPSIARRSMDRVNRSDGFMWRNFFLINSLHRSGREQPGRVPVGRRDVEGRAVEGGVKSAMASPGMRSGDAIAGFTKMTARLATDEDDPAIRRLLRDKSFGTSVSVAMTADPNHAAAMEMLGRHRTVVVERGGIVVSVGTVTTRRRFVNGRRKRRSAT